MSKWSQQVLRDSVVLYRAVFPLHRPPFVF